MKNFCFSERYATGSGFSDTEEDLEEDYVTDYDEEENVAGDLRARYIFTVSITIIAFFLGLH